MLSLAEADSFGRLQKKAQRGNGKCSSLRRTHSKSTSDKLSKRENNCVLIGLLTEPVLPSESPDGSQVH